MGPVARAVVRGGAAGAAATVPMSLVMLAAGRVGAMGTQPPERVAEEALGRAGADDTSEETQNVAASVAHLAFGAGSGAAFALMRRGLGLRTPIVAQGCVFGLGVWAASYQGWIPALGILPPPERDRPGRRRTMIAAHVVYGGVLGVLEGRLAGGSGGAAGG